MHQDGVLLRKVLLKCGQLWSALLALRRTDLIHPFFKQLQVHSSEIQGPDFALCQCSLRSGTQPRLPLVLIPVMGLSILWAPAPVMLLLCFVSYPDLKIVVLVLLHSCISLPGDRLKSHIRMRAGMCFLRQHTMWWIPATRCAVPDPSFFTQAVCGCPSQSIHSSTPPATPPSQPLLKGAGSEAECHFSTSKMRLCKHTALSSRQFTQKMQCCFFPWLICIV